MDFNHFVSGFLASLLLVVRRIVLLMWTPYKTMRRIAADEDLTQVVIIMIFVGLYYWVANHFRPYDYAPSLLFLIAVFHFILTAAFFAVLRILFTKELKVNVYPFLMLFAYAMIPTLVWFAINSWLYAILPPPRTPSLLGKGFSMVYLTFSIGILLWKIIVTYLAVRFSTGFTFFRIMYSMLLYLAVVIPYSLLLYAVKLFRIPFL